jgi:hypothetical protein
MSIPLCVKCKKEPRLKGKDHKGNFFKCCTGYECVNKCIEDKYIPNRHQCPNSKYKCQSSGCLLYRAHGYNFCGGHICMGRKVRDVLASQQSSHSSHFNPPQRYIQISYHPPHPVPMRPIGLIGPMGPIGSIGPMGHIGSIGPMGPIRPMGPMRPMGFIRPIGPIGLMRAQWD